MSARHAAVLLAALVRAAPRTPVAIATAAALITVGAVAALTDERYTALALQASAPALAGAAAALLDEPPLDGLPTTLARRRAMLLAAALPLLALVWWGLLTLAGPVRAGPLTLQLSAVVAVTLGLAACGDIARAVAGVGLAFGAARGMLAPQLFPAGPEAPHWVSAQIGWAGLACAGLALLAVASHVPVVARVTR